MQPQLSDSIVVRLTVAALAGLAVGLEREWSGHATGPSPRFAGLRTFFLLGTLGGVAGWLASSESVGALAIGVALLIAAAALVVSAYFLTARPGGQAVEATTEVAALSVLALGTLAGFGYLVVASGAAAVIVLALSEKKRLRAAVSRIGEAELRAALQFAVLALVILPLLPNETYGPLGGIQPRALWTVVLVFTGLNFVGYLARKAVGPARGYGVTGILGGLVSSTAVTFQFARVSREDRSLGIGLAIGVIGACTVLLPRVALVSAVLNHRVALALIPFLLPAFILGAAITAIAVWRQSDKEKSKKEETLESPLKLWSAIRMAFAFQLSLMAISLVRDTLGARGVIASAALLGLTDMDALTVSMNRLGTTEELIVLAARAIAVGVLANSVLKIVLVLTLGTGIFRRLAAIGIAALLLVGAVSLWLFWSAAPL
ncbi:MAG TPA: MgtC/SapB family protein [Gemmatimonadaceae bacterium]|jgi:uncharacterized membrane protein (DUF4010 family)|nr:MgtC/SapB family protein [Gemmatimonadaceae bacterium]